MPYRLLPTIIVMLFLIAPFACHAQFADCSTGLLQMPTAEMQEDGTFMITNNFLNKHSLASSGWDYNTFQYGVAVSFWGRIEVGYICTIFNDRWSLNPYGKDLGFERINQDRHFAGRICVLREGDLGWRWLPSLVVGMSDPVTGSGSDEYTGSDVTGASNGFFNRNFIVLTKHFSSPWGEFGAHVGYQINKRKDYHINAPCFGIDWQPKWLQQKGLIDRLEVIAEYDSRTVNIGTIASIWDDRFEAMFELQNFQWVNFGIRYKLRIKKY